MTEIEAHREIDSTLKGYARTWRHQADELCFSARGLLAVRELSVPGMTASDVDSPEKSRRFFMDHAHRNREFDSGVLEMLDRAGRLRRMADDAERGILAIEEAEREEFAFDLLQIAQRSHRLVFVRSAAKP